MSNIIQFSNVYKSYPGQEAIRDANFTLPTGKVIGLVGPNGSGKSTTLKLIAGLIRPDKGEVLINGQKTNRRISSTVAYLSELDELYPFFTVAETIHFYNDMYSDFDLAKAEEIVAFMQLDKSKQVKKLSKGNRGRLKLVLTLARQVPLVLMDEPLSGLDPMVRDSIIKGLITYVDLDRQTVVLSTHELAEIEPLLDMVVAIKNGQVLKIDEVEKIRDEQNISLVEWMKRNLN